LRLRQYCLKFSKTAIFQENDGLFRENQALFPKKKCSQSSAVIAQF